MMKHYSVLLTECIEGLHIQENGVYVDGTLGRGGHSKAILENLTTGHLYAFDRDMDAIEESKQYLEQMSEKVTFVHTNFSNMKEKLQSFGVEAIDGLLLDLGVSSPQFDEAHRGFSYRFDAYLDMRMDQSQALTAYEIINTYSYHDLVRIMYQYGDESYAKQIARKIEQRREIKPICTTFELVDIIKSALPAKVLNRKGHPAKKVFQAIRIAVNNELEELQKVLEDALSILKVGGRICVISFQSLEDKIVKEIFHKMSRNEKVDKRIPLLPNEIGTPPYKMITKKPLVAMEKELMENRRSHSAKLRIIERVR
ncbi:MAG: 16S rRNA (cytosine(1402)-N(4))-methyltransferase RsmH [Erysipelotrichaceae bacterium]|nr:16S rRNA (cytosine(1402)-N(4))-methyltransferase RsmH [Erysipelotrichaceae bacterium]